MHRIRFRLLAISCFDGTLWLSFELQENRKRDYGGWTRDSDSTSYRSTYVDHQSSIVLYGRVRPDKDWRRFNKIHAPKKISKIEVDPISLRIVHYAIFSAFEML
ncbi:hypothetical protein L596_011206 [Steinernema carpocapsae]|uniref:Uncharacterized protein n=1 Tax=Steinernema carpocapsae TaxID=34508 RepID=A0A4U5NTZ2_STECR|nr:hypothetical protein L596_011206 [Steinernema carpocapsae]